MEPKELSSVEVKELSLSDRQGELLDNASWMAKKLKKIIEEGDLAVDCGGKKKHVTLEAWTTVARLQLECPHAKLVKTYKDDAGNEVVEAHGWVTDAADKIVSEADAVVSEREKNWKGKHLSARVSMAQTRAMSKALRLRHSWIMVMAGYSATPAEEMEPIVVVDTEAVVKENKEAAKVVEPIKTDEQLKDVKPKDPVLTWEGEIKDVQDLELPNGKKAWGVTGKDGSEFKTTDSMCASLARDTVGQRMTIKYEYNSKKTKVLKSIYTEELVNG